MLMLNEGCNVRRRKPCRPLSLKSAHPIAEVVRGTGNVCNSRLASKQRDEWFSFDCLCADTMNIFDGRNRIETDMIRLNTNDVPWH